MAASSGSSGKTRPSYCAPPRNWSAKAPSLERRPKPLSSAVAITEAAAESAVAAEVRCGSGAGAGETRVDRSCAAPGVAEASVITVANASRWRARGPVMRFIVVVIEVSGERGCTRPGLAVPHLAGRSVRGGRSDAPAKSTAVPALLDFHNPFI